MRLRSILAALAAVALCGAGPAPAAPAQPPALTKADVDAWLDGFMPYGLASADIPGGVVVVVKDGQILTERGYGYADIKSRRKVDPKTTLFRPGSISKTFVWTAVMQQVEAGKIDLDADVNKYLDFKIPARDGQPITMRNLMTHQPGYEEHLKRLFVSSPAQLQTLGDFVKTTPPERVYAPGKVPTYSNYGAALAGYIVQRVSGEPFDDYMDRHLFGPLSMTRSTFRQPLPARFAPDMATAYATASGPALPYELVNGRPAGSISATGDDMAHFMIAHLANGRYGGASILKPETAMMMHAEQKPVFPPLLAMGLGFVHEDTNGHVIVGHNGGTGSFHSDMHLLIGDNVGVFVSLNAPGKDGAYDHIHATLYRGFMDRYFPALHPLLPAVASAQAHARAIEGLYWPSRRAHSSFFSITNLTNQMKVVAAADGTIQAKGLEDSLTDRTKTWREVGPWLWQDDTGTDRLKAIVEDGRVTGFTTDSMRSANVMQRVPGWALVSWNLPLLFCVVGLLLACVALWPVQALVRRAYGRSFPLSGRRALLYRLTRVAAIAQLLGFAAFAYVVSRLASLVGNLDNTIDPPLRLAQGLCLLGLAGVAVEFAGLVVAWRDRGSSWWAKASTALVALAGLGFAWFVVSLKLITVSTLF